MTIKKEQNILELETDFTRLVGCRYPIIGAPMFLVSNVDMVVAISEAGCLGAIPSLNFRATDDLRQNLKKIRQRTKQPFAVNLIISNDRLKEDFKVCLEQGVEVFTTSLGNPKDVIRDAHLNGAKVFCNVIHFDHAKKVVDADADGLLAVSAGAGGHAGTISPLILVPWLKKHFSIPIIASGSVSDGRTMAAMINIGASAVSMGTRFIASNEAPVSTEYKEAILRSRPEDIVLTNHSGAAANFIKESLPTNQNQNQNQNKTTNWKTVWSAGQSVALIDEILPCEQIINQIISDCKKTLNYC